MVVKESMWTKLFGEYFLLLGTEDQDTERKRNEDDDMLFYVRSRPGERGQEVSAVVSVGAAVYLIFSHQMT